jgi:hypothetical protein
VYVPAGVLRLRVLSWNLGPGAARWQDLAAALAGWEWDVALLRGVPARWPDAVATALDAEFRCAPPGGTGRLRQLLGAGGPGGLLSRRGAGATDAILARYDRIVGEWPDGGRRVPEPAVSAARLACGVWIGNVQMQTPPGSVTDWVSDVDGEAIVLGGSRAVAAQDPFTTLTELGRAGPDGLWATTALVPVGEPELLAGGTDGGGSPLAITLERRP